MVPRRPPLQSLTVWEINAIQWGLGVSSVLSCIASLLICGYIFIRLVLQARRNRARRVAESPISSSEGYEAKTEFLRARARSVSSQTIHVVTESGMWLLLWFSELVVLCLGLCDFGSALWYLLQLHALDIPCTNVMGFWGTVFEPASVVSCTVISISMLVLLRRSLVLQTRKEMRVTLICLLCVSYGASFGLPLILAGVFAALDQFGSDLIYCWLSPEHSSATLRLWAYYLPIFVLLFCNVCLMLAIAYTNYRHRMRLSKLALFWVPTSLLLVWCIPCISTAWSVLSPTVPFALVFASVLLLPSQGIFNFALFAILLGRGRKLVHQTTTRIASSAEYDDHDAQAFFVDEVQLNLFGEKITWFFCE